MFWLPLCDLIDGVLVEKGMGFAEAALVLCLMYRIEQFAGPNGLGLAVGEGGMVQLWPGRVRIPDGAFFSWGRLPDRKCPQEPIPAISPDLAIEAISTSNAPKEMLLKRQDYFATGTLLIWEVDPRQRTVAV